MANDTSNNNTQNSMPSLGEFKPYQYSGNKKDGEGQRMAGDMLNDFTKGNVAKVLGASSNKDYRNGVENNNNNSAYQPTVDNASNAKTNTKANDKPSQPTVAASTGSKSFALAPPKSGEKYYADSAEVKAAWNGTYDENKYKYYKGKNGTSTGADAYHTDMANYQAQMASMGDNPHLGLVNQMMHPDWKDQNYSNGKYGDINKGADYSQKPDDWDNLNARSRALQKQMESSR